MKVIESKSYIKDIKKIKDKKTKKQLYQKLKKIIENPKRAKYLRNIMKLKQSERIGKFRLIYEWNQKEDILYLLRFRKRGEVYK